MAGKKKGKLLKAHVTHLEMDHQNFKTIPTPSRPRLALLQTNEMPVSFYRYLYEQIGKPYHWYERRIMSDKKLLEIIHADTTKIDVLYADGSPAGFFEIDSSGLPDSVELVYFGLVPDYQGLGIGKWFLYCAIQNAWQMGPQKLKIHTNTLDHPAALGLYQKMGFFPVGVSEEEITAWE